MAEAPDVETTPGLDIARSEINRELTTSRARRGLHDNPSTLEGEQVVEGDAAENASHRSAQNTAQRQAVTRRSGS